MDYAKPFAKVGKATFTVTLKDTEYSKTFEVSVKAADKTALNNAIAAAEKLTEDKYESGWDAFQAAFDAAKKVAADEDATPAQVADALAALQAARKALVKVDGEKPGPQEPSTKPAPQKPAVKPSPNGKVDATEPSGLSKTGASTMAFAVAAVLLLAAGAAMVGGAGAPSKARAAIPRFWHVGMAAAEKSVAAIILRRHVVTTDCMGRLMRTGCSREPPSRPHFSLLRESHSQNSQIWAVFVGFSLVSASCESAGLVAARASSRKGPVSGLRDVTFAGWGQST